MILSFKPQFKEAILNGTKIHTIREDKSNRWQVGNIIHFATGVRTKNYNQFYKGICLGEQKIKIIWKLEFKIASLFIDNRFIPSDEVEEIAINDGFKSADDFFNWFNKDFKGKIIHWTNHKY